MAVCTDLTVPCNLVQFDEFPMIKSSSTSDPTLYSLLAFIDGALQLFTLGYQVRELQDSTFEVGNGDATCASLHSICFV